MPAESRHVEIVFDDMIRISETGFDIAPVGVGKGNVTFWGRTLGIASP